MIPCSRNNSLMILHHHLNIIIPPAPVFWRQRADHDFCAPFWTMMAPGFMRMTVSEQKDKLAMAFAIDGERGMTECSTLLIRCLDLLNLPVGCLYGCHDVGLQYHALSIFSLFFLILALSRYSLDTLSQYSPYFRYSLTLRAALPCGSRGD
jgi:hypothetical protein